MYHIKFWKNYSFNLVVHGCNKLNTKVLKISNNFYAYLSGLILWVPVNSIDKVSIFDGWIRDLGINPAYTKNRYVSWFDNKKLLSRVNAIHWNPLKKKKWLVILIKSYHQGLYYFNRNIKSLVYIKSKTQCYSTFFF